MKQILILFFLSILILSFTSCEDESVEQNNYSIGVNTAVSTISGAEVYDAIITSLEENDDIKIVAEVNHSANALASEVTLPYTRVVLFGNPRLGTPLMKENRLVGLDLPQKILVTENENGSVEVSYNSSTYLRQRHNLSNSDILFTINEALKDLVSKSAVSIPELRNNDMVDNEEGVSIHRSNKRFDDLYAAVKEQIENNPNINLIAELDHAANASSVGLELDKTKLLVFGNPKLGSPLMKDASSLGIDLPQKMLVYEEDGEVFIAYNKIDFLLDRHLIESNLDIKESIEIALQSIVTNSI